MGSSMGGFFRIHRRRRPNVCRPILTSPFRSTQDGKYMSFSANFFTSKLCSVAEQTINCSRRPSLNIFGIFACRSESSFKLPCASRASISSMMKKLQLASEMWPSLIRLSRRCGVATVVIEDGKRELVRRNQKESVRRATLDQESLSIESPLD